MKDRRTGRRLRARLPDELQKGRDRKAERNLLRRISRREIKEHDGMEGQGQGSGRKPDKGLRRVGQPHPHFRDQSPEPSFSVHPTPIPGASP